MDKFRNSFMNLALPFWLFSEPQEAIKNKDKDYDPIMMGPVKAVPSNFTTWDKIIIPGSLTLGEFIGKIKADYKVVVSIMSSG